MANAWQTPHRQPNHIQPTLDTSSQSSRWQTAFQADPNAAIQDCSCSWCSVPRYNDQLAPHTIEYLGASFPGYATFPRATQSRGAENPMGVTGMGDVRTQPQVDVPAALGNFDYSLPPEELGNFRAQTSAGLGQPQIFYMSVTEGLRRLAVRYVNNPDSLITEMHLEPGLPGQFRVVITLEICDIL